MVEELHDVRNSLKADLKQISVGFKLELAHGLQMLTNRFEAFKAEVDKSLTEADTARRQFIVENAGFIEGSIARLQKEIHSNAAVLQSRVAEHLGAMEISLQAARVREVARDEAVDRRITEHAVATAAQTEVRWLALKCLLEQESRDVRSSLHDLRKDFGLQGNSLQALADAGFAKLDVMLKDAQVENGNRFSSLETELRGRVNHLEESFRNYTEKGDLLMSSTVAKTEKDVNDIRTETQSRMAWLDEQSQRLRTLVNTVENIPTRRVDWELPNAAERLPDLLRGDVLRSPPFEAAGSSGLRLELSIPESGQAERLCDLALIGRKGLFVVVRLCVGSAAVQLEHTFDGESRCVARELCTLTKQISADGSLPMGIEVLEAVSSAPLDRGSTTSAGALLGNGGQEVPDDGHMVMHRYLNNRMLDLVQDQVDIMKSRMVRKIEWRIERASSLAGLFPQGECLCSTPFEAAGVQGLQMVFYPSGYHGAREGFCSYFLHVPPGAALRCWLSIGSHRREGRLAFEEPGIYGRTNFCRLEYAIDATEDAILLVLEIDEAQQSCTETLLQEARSHYAPQALAATRAPSPTRASSPTRGEEDLFPQVQARARVSSGSDMTTAKEKVESSLTFRKNPGKSVLEDVRQLPSIWTSRPQANLAEALEGFHTFTEIKPTRKPQSRSRAPSSLGCRPDSVTPTPGVQQRYMMYA